MAISRWYFKEEPLSPWCATLINKFLKPKANLAFYILFFAPIFTDPDSYLGINHFKGLHKKARQ